MCHLSNKFCENGSFKQTIIDENMTFLAEVRNKELKQLHSSVYS